MILFDYIFDCVLPLLALQEFPRNGTQMMVKTRKLPLKVLKSAFISEIGVQKGFQHANSLKEKIE